MEFNGRKLSVELGRLAGQANGSCRVQYGNTVVLAVATMSENPKESDYFPLMVDYEERYYAAGKIKGSKWIKRETRPSDEAILSGRLIDRTIRPRFDQSIRNEVQVVALVLSFDGENDPDIPALFGASLALMISDIPFDGPVAGVRIGRVDGKLVINPTYEQRVAGDFDIVVSGTENRINMVEAGANIIPEKNIIEAIEFGFKEIKKLSDFQKKIASEAGVEKKMSVIIPTDGEFSKKAAEFLNPILEKVVYTADKQAYYHGLESAKKSLEEHVSATYQGDKNLGNKLKKLPAIFDETVSQLVHKNVLEKDKRPDGRKPDELRNISAEVAVLPQAHGSGLFNRGSTQALSILTLAAPGMEQWIETMEINLTKKRFMHHYVFPPFSVGEVGRMGGAGRREIGHGALAERALLPLIPEKTKFPYTIRLVSEILSSNGSSSMASVCGSSLALMDGGVPIPAPAAGIAMGIMLGDKNDYKILTDIQGPEDYFGDMDLKVAGTKDGVTAMQMDVKVEGVTAEILEKALTQARKARLEILEVMDKTIAAPRANLSEHAPRIEILHINPEKIRSLIGPQGKVINDIINKTGVEIDIEQDGSVFVSAMSNDAMEKAKGMIKEITYEAVTGDEFDGKVTRLFEFGAMVEFMPGHEGLVHVSEISDRRIAKPSDVLKTGQVVHVRVKNIDSYGRINLTMRPDNERGNI
ncbi:MAG: polyribonucleotide nucleotidyltransferase [Parcubacteria group bacterium Licking1014_17]|nr:MAG: polyribonucleotide nucleotidyltransferase [Parcubacteria group bacterium Licking1014_17]